MNGRLNKLIKGDPIEEGVASTIGNLAGKATRKVADAGKDFKQGFQAGMTKDQQTQPSPPAQPEQPDGTPPDEDEPKTDQQIHDRQPEPHFLTKFGGVMQSLKHAWHHGSGEIPKEGGTYYDDDNKPYKFSKIDRGITTGQPDAFEFDHVDPAGTKYRLYATAVKGGGTPLPVKVKYTYDDVQNEAVPPPSPEEMRKYDANKDGKLRSTRNARGPGGEELYRMGHARIFGDKEPKTKKQCYAKCKKVQQVIKDFFGVDMDEKTAISIVKNPKDRLLKHMVNVDPEINMTYDTKQVKLRGDQIGVKGPIGQRHHVAQVEPVNEQASAESVGEFAKKLKIGKVDKGRLDLVASKWPEFIEAVKQKLDWDYSIKYGADEQQPETAKDTGEIYGYLVKIQPGNPNSEWRLTHNRPKGFKLTPATDRRTGSTTTLFESKLAKINKLVKGD